MGLILASASPRRKELLSNFITDFRIVPADIDEVSIVGKNPLEKVQNIATAKASKVSESFKEDFILSADTVVTFTREDKDITLGKPNSEQEAREMLQSLSGRFHRVLSAFALINYNKSIREVIAVETKVYFATLQTQDIEEYIKTGEPFDKAGAYAIQGYASAFIEKIEGSYSCVVGLPLFEVLKVLKKYNLWQMNS